jgi:hypothetical protein
MGFHRLVGVMCLDNFDVGLSREHSATSLDHHGMVVDDENAHGSFHP